MTRMGRRARTVESAVRTEITVETSEIRIVTRPRGNDLMSCHVCNAVVQGLRPEVAALLIGVPIRIVYQMIEAESIHFDEQSDGTVLICPSSLIFIRDITR